MQTMRAPATELAVSTGTTSVDVRCPLPHPSRPGEPCDRLLVRYERPTVGTVGVVCPRCKGRLTLVITAPSTSEGR